MRRLLSLPLAVIVLAATPLTASAFTVGVQDQGADPEALANVAGDLGARTVRVIASPQNPQTTLIKRYRDAGLQVQAAIAVKRGTTAGDVRGVMRAWHGMVDTVSVGNEPELNGVPACTYARLFARSSAMIRREFPGTVIGFGEFSPAMAFEYIQKIARCHVRIRAAFTAVHPYQFFSDPLGAPTERSGVGTWLGLGNLGRVRRALGRYGLPARLRATEFSYLVDGRYKIPMEQCARNWPRAFQQARKYVEQLIIYGMGVVPAGTWGSACLLDASGHRTPAFLAIARALGRTITLEHPMLPTGVLPDGSTSDREPPLPVRNDLPDTGGQSDDAAPETAHGADTPDESGVSVPPEVHLVPPVCSVTADDGTVTDCSQAPDVPATTTTGEPE